MGTSALLGALPNVWADDLAVPRVCDSAARARAAICETGLLTDAMGEFGLR